MRKSNHIRIYFPAGVILVVLSLTIFGCNFLKSTDGKIKNLLEGDTKITIKNDTETLLAPELTSNYYSQFGSLQPQNKTERYRQMLHEMLNYADTLGLDSAIYHRNYLYKYDSLLKQQGYDSYKHEAGTEIILTDAALSFLYHAAYGKNLKHLQYNGISYQIDSAKILRALNNMLTDYDWRKSLDSIEPKFPQYVFLKNILIHMNVFLKHHPEIDSSISKVTDRKNIVMKLKAYNLLPDSMRTDFVSESVLTEALKNFQLMMNLNATGKINNQTLRALLFPIQKRIHEIKESINCWRWMNRLNNQEFFLVNIPAAQLQLVNKDSATDMHMKVIVGKESTRTPAFATYIAKIVAYPYWTVPLSIATKEMLPKIKKRLAYLDENDLQVINSKGEVLAPEKIAWQSLSRNYFPYIIRQSTGCDNSLGVLKFELNTPFSIYMHDTNVKSLFNSDSRFLSHGCIRLEKPMEIASFLLRDGLDSTIINRLNSCVKNQNPQDFLLKKKFPVFVLYMTAEADKNGKLKFYNDVYKKE